MMETPLFGQKDNGPSVFFQVLQLVLKLVMLQTLKMLVEKSKEICLVGVMPFLQMRVNLIVVNILWKKAKFLMKIICKEISIVPNFFVTHIARSFSITSIYFLSSWPTFRCKRCFCTRSYGFFWPSESGNTFFILCLNGRSLTKSILLFYRIYPSKTIPYQTFSLKLFAFSLRLFAFSTFFKLK